MCREYSSCHLSRLFLIFHRSGTCISTSPPWIANIDKKEQLLYHSIFTSSPGKTTAITSANWHVFQSFQRLDQSTPNAIFFPLKSEIMCDHFILIFFEVLPVREKKKKVWTSEKSDSFFSNKNLLFGSQIIHKCSNVVFFLKPRKNKTK